MFVKKYAIVEHGEVMPGHRLLCLDAPGPASASSPGQFLHVRCSDALDPLLRRPFSIHYADREKGRVYILYKIAGRGTALMAEKRPGDFLDVMGPLGKGYTLPGRGERVAVVGGGMGAAPLFFLLREIRNLYGDETGKVSVFLGAATGELVPGRGMVEAMGFSLEKATDDGSDGFKGSVVDLFAIAQEKEIFDRVYACGPAAMLKKLSSVVRPETRAEVSLEERMGCGVGACLSCACEVKKASGKTVNAHICTDGPVFDIKELCW
ncbi:MAG: dihydroorotate dehydrogenase electron transfer subunit [Bacillota bacterium]